MLFESILVWTIAFTGVDLLRTIQLTCRKREELGRESGFCRFVGIFTFDVNRFAQFSLIINFAFGTFFFDFTGLIRLLTSIMRLRDPYGQVRLASSIHKCSNHKAQPSTFKKRVSFQPLSNYQGPIINPLFWLGHLNQTDKRFNWLFVVLFFSI